MNEFLRRILFLPEQRSTVAQEIDSLHYFVIRVTMASATVVALAAIYFMWKYRRSAMPDEEAPTPRAFGTVPLWLEVAVITGLLGLFVLWWVIGFRQYMRLRAIPPDAMEVYVVAKKWMWTFAYPNGASSNADVYVPAGQPIKLVMTSRDVIHSFYVPDFRIKQDVIPGRFSFTWFEANRPGIYEILCTEYCGMGHSTMRGRVIALAPEEYEERLGGLQRLAIAGPRFSDPAVVGVLPKESLTLAEMGVLAANRHGCLRCHTVDGTPHIGPTWARAYGSTVVLTTGATVVADDAYLTRSIMDPMAEIHRGFAPVMPPYQGILSASEIGAIVEYIRSLRDVPIGAPTSPLPLGPIELQESGRDGAVPGDSE